MRGPRAAAHLIACLAVVAGCGGGASTTDSPRSVDGAPTVAVGFYPLAFVTERVGGDGVEVSNLAEPGAEPHDLELSPRQAGDLEDVDLVVYLRGFQPAIDDAVGTDNTLDVAALKPLVEADPHVWLDPSRLGEIADAVAHRLAEIDPAGGPGYADRAADLIADLNSLDASMAAGLRSCRLREFVTSHDAFGYLARRYQLEQLGISGLDPEADPSPARLREVAAFVRANGVTTIFFETLLSPKAARTVADETGAVTAVLDPIESVAAGSADDYFVVMRRNLAALRSALGCT